MFLNTMERQKNNRKIALLARSKLRSIGKMTSKALVRSLPLTNVEQNDFRMKERRSAERY